MLVQIPSTSDAIDDRGRIYTVSIRLSHFYCMAKFSALSLACCKVFNIYIGGHYHCSLRYSHLFNFSQEV